MMYRAGSSLPTHFSVLMGKAVGCTKPLGVLSIGHSKNASTAWQLASGIYIVFSAQWGYAWWLAAPPNDHS